MRTSICLTLTLSVLPLGMVASGCPIPVTEDRVKDPVDPSDLDDTAPEPTTHDESLTFTARGVTRNHSTDRFRFDVASYKDDAQREQMEQLLPNHAAFLTQHSEEIPSVQTISTVLKQLDDTIYAGVERAVQDGLSNTFQPKREVLTGALEHLKAHRNSDTDQALVSVAAALELGGATVDVPGDLRERVQQHKADFLADTAHSKPIGFYTWSPELQAIFQQDRLLQQPLGSAGIACALAQAIVADDARRQRYLDLVEVYQRMTNPLETNLASMLPATQHQGCPNAFPAAFLSASRTPETELYNKLYPNGVPEGVNLMDELIKAIRNGTVDLAPRPEDGWYAHQLYALETLLVTDRSEERGKVAFMSRYKKRLQEAFKTMLVQHRETHVKQAGFLGMTDALPLVPQFRVEPLATVYVRHARSYVFLEMALEEVLGASFLDTAVAVDKDGPTQQSLRARIRMVRDLYFGLYLICCQELGMHPRLDKAGDPELTGREVLVASADDWLINLGTNPLAAMDVRVIVPIAELPDGRMRYWAVIGVRGTQAGYSFIEGKDVSAPSPEKQARIPLPTEAFMEVTSSSVPLTRDEFRALCDQHKTESAIRTALEAR